MKRILPTTAILLATAGVASATVIAQWNFNSATPDSDVTSGTLAPSTGAGTAATVNGPDSAFATGDTAHDPAGSADNSAWETKGYPGASVGNKTAGVRFGASTVGYEHVTVSWYQRNSATASRYARFQYTTDGLAFVDGTVISLTADSVFTAESVDLSGVAGVTNNPNFGFRILTEFESTASGSGNGAYVATKSGSTYSSQGTMRFEMVTVSGTPFPDGNTPPYIFAGIADQTLRPGQTTGPLAFLVLDAESPATNLTLSAASSNPDVILVTNIVFAGSGADRTVSVTAGTQPGFCRATIYVTDPGGKSSSTSFGVTVLPGNTAPYISTIACTNTLASMPVVGIPFTVSDAETPSASLTVSGSSANTELVASTNLVFGGSGSNRSLAITPAAGQTGVAPITVTVSDGTNTASTVFALMVVPSPAVIFYDPFTYGDGSLLTNSGFLWNNRSGTKGECQVTNKQLEVTAAQTEDVVGGLIGAPYTKGTGTVLYASFQAKFVSLPGYTPGLFAHFANGSTLRGRIYAGTSNAPSGYFRLLVANGSATNAPLARDLSTNVVYTLVTRYDVDAAVTTLWVNPASEAEPGVAEPDPQTASTVASYGFRQDPDIGADILIDDVKVGLSFAAVAPGTGPIPLDIARNGNNVVLSWSNAAFGLQAAPAVGGVYTNLPGVVSPWTNALGGPARFFRLIRNL